MAATLAYAALSYQVGAPSTRGTAIRATSAAMQEQQYKLNNYMLPGPLTPLADQVRALPQHTGCTPEDVASPDSLACRGRFWSSRARWRMSPRAVSSCQPTQRRSRAKAWWCWRGRARRTRRQGS
eukprot:scaffold40025_cov42-Phaeocystis_antarctica.AAC.3